MERSTESLRPHVHVNTSSRDCDGPLHTGRTVMAEREDWERAVFCGPSLTPQDVARSMAERYAVPTLIGTYERSYAVVEPSWDEGSYTVVSVSWADETDEGFTAVEIVACVDPACTAVSWQRDVFAEAAGY